MTEDQMWQQAMEAKIKWENEIYDWNAKFLSDNDIPEEDFKDLMEYVYYNEKIEPVEGPKGQRQDEEYGKFKDVHVEQWSVGDSGDSYAGFIYMRVGEKWFRIYYEC